MAYRCVSIKVTPTIFYSLIEFQVRIKESEGKGDMIFNFLFIVYYDSDRKTRVPEIRSALR